MKFVILSDTHCQHGKIDNIPNGDFLIHAGDFTSMGRPNEIHNFMKWFVNNPHKHKILIPGNHELTLCPRKRNYVLHKAVTSKNSWKMKRLFRDFIDAKSIVNLFSNDVHFLDNTGVTLEGVNFYGSPICNGDDYVMENWGFYRDTDKELIEEWNKIPFNTDVLITHVPPYGVLDAGYGCKHLLSRVNKIHPYLHIFGHIHSHGCLTLTTDKTVFVNGAMLDDDYSIKNRKIMVHEI